MSKPYITAGIEADLHKIITKEAAQNKQSFSAQIREYRDKAFALEEQNNELREHIRKFQDVN